MQRIIWTGLACLFILCLGCSKADIPENAGGDGKTAVADVPYGATPTPSPAMLLRTEQEADMQNMLQEKGLVLNAPDTCSFDLETESGERISFRNVPVLVPAADALQSVSIQARRFDDETVERIADAIFQKHLGYLASGTPMSKAHAELVIMDLQDQITSGNLDSKYDSISEAEAAIAEVEAELPSLPDKFALQSPDFSWVDMGRRSEMLLFATPDHARISELCLNDSENPFFTSVWYYRDSTMYAWLEKLTGMQNIMPLEIIFASALVERELQANGKAVQELMANLPISDYSCQAVRVIARDNDDPVYEFIFTKSYQGVQVNYATITYSYEAILENDGRVLPMECLRIWTDTEGVLMLLWKHPSDILEVVEEKVILLDFQEILENGKKALKEAVETGNIRDVSLSRISLGYRRIYDDSARRQELLIPVWDIYGTYVDKESGKRIGEDGFTSIVTLDAVTGQQLRRS